MASAHNSGLIIDEMFIVDIFTRLIFDSASELDGSETLVIELLVQMDDTLPHASRRDISEYLRAMGCDEMIAVVSKIKCHMEQQQGLIAANKSTLRQPLHR